MTDDKRQEIDELDALIQAEREAHDRLCALAEARGVSGRDLREYAQDVAREIVDGHARAQDNARSVIGFLVEQDEPPEAVELAILDTLRRKGTITPEDAARREELQKVLDARE